MTRPAVRLLLLLAVAAGCASPAPVLAPFPDEAAAKTDPALVALYEAYRAGTAPAAAAPALMTTDDAVRIEASAADGDGEGLAVALGRLGLADPSSYGVLVNGMLPIASLPAAAALDDLRFLRPVVPPARTPPRPPDRL